MRRNQETLDGTPSAPSTSITTRNVEPSGRQRGKTTPRRTNQWKSRCQPSLCTRRGPQPGRPAPASSVKAQVFEERVDLSNDMTWRQMVAVGVRRESSLREESSINSRG